MHLTAKNTFIILLLFLSSCAFAQELKNTQFNYTIENGLPDNHIYRSTTDKFGYLWVCTPVGVARYNGYELKLFGNAEGLPNEDVWNLVEDKNGRVWLGTISDEMGYIYNNKYYNVSTNAVNSTIYPRCMHPFGNGMSFILFRFNGREKSVICFADSKKIKHFTLDSIEFDKTTRKDQYVGYPIVTENNDSLFIYGKNIYKFRIENDKIKTTLLHKTDVEIFEITMNNFNGFGTIGKFIMPRHLSDHSLYLNVETGITAKFPTDSNTNQLDMYFCNQYNKNTFYAIDDKSATKYKINNEQINLDTIQPIADFIPDASLNGNNITAFFQTNFWGTCIATNTNGLYINPEKRCHFTKLPNINLKYFKLVSAPDDNSSYWWNFSEKTLAKIDYKNNITYSTSKVVSQVNDIKHYRGDTLFIAGNLDMWLDKKSGAMTKITDTIFRINNKKVIINVNNQFFLTSPFTFDKIDLNKNIRTRTIIDNERYSNLLFDTARNSYWAYHPHKIYIHNKKKTPLLTKNNFKKLALIELNQLQLMVNTVMFLFSVTKQVNTSF